MKQVISTSGAPAAIGSYSQAISANGFLYLSGQLPIDPQNGNIVSSDIKHQTRQCLLNVKAILEAAGLGLENVVKTDVFLKSMNDFGAMNEVYKEFFSETPPARVAVEVARLPKDAKVEIDAIASF